MSSGLASAHTCYRRAFFVRAFFLWLSDGAGAPFFAWSSIKRVTASTSSAGTDIQVSTDVYAALWAARKPGEDNEDAILRRVLAVPTEASQPSDKPTASPPMRWTSG